MNAILFRLHACRYEQQKARHHAYGQREALPIRLEDFTEEMFGDEKVKRFIRVPTPLPSPQVSGDEED